MGKRGPAAKPRALIELEGNPGRRAVSPEEPQPPALIAVPPPPEFLKGKAKDVWATALPYLINVRTMTEGDLLAFSRYCDTFEEWFKARNKVKLNGATTSVKNEKGVVLKTVEAPWFKNYRTLNRDLLRMEQEFGLTPSARTRVRMILSIPDGPSEAEEIDDDGFDFAD